MSGVERYIEQYRAHRTPGGSDGVVRPNRRRMVVLTAAFTPMMAVAVLPVTGAVSVGAWMIAQATASWVGVAVIVTAASGLGYLAARWGARHDDGPATSGWRRWLPVGATVVVAGSSLAEIVTGSRAPDPVIVLWLASIAWVVAFLPLAAGVWGPTRRVLWTVGPVLTFAAILVVWTQGFFALRFARAVPDLDDVVRQVADGERVPEGTHVGGFVVHDVNVGRLATNAGCDAELWITGWHEQDTRYIAHCVDPPRGDFTHLARDWWQLDDKRPPSDLRNG